MQTAQTHEGDRLLRGALMGNAVFSGISGAVLVVGFGPIGSFMGMDIPGLLIGLGVALLLFAGGLVLLVRQSTIGRTWAIIISMAEVAWVIASGVILLIGPELLTMTGHWLIIVVADIVAVFAVLQLWGVRQISA